MGSADMSDGRSANFTLRQGEVIYSTGGCSVFGVFEEACGSAVGVRKDFGMNVSLVLVQTDGKQREVPIKKSVQVIGRQTDCQIRIPSANVSRHHCEVSASDDGHITVRDLGSSNGTFVNKQKVTQASVNAGDLLLTIEAMKMETGLHADRAATVKALHVHAGSQIDAKDLLIELE